MRGAGNVLGDIETLVGAVYRLAVHRVVGVHDAGALLEDRVGGLAGRLHNRGGRTHQPALDLIGRERRVRLQHQRDRATDGRSGLRGPGHREGCTVIGSELRVLQCDRHGLLFHQADHMAARGDDVRLDEALDRGAGRGEGGDAVIGLVAGRKVIRHRADRDHVGRVARHRDRLLSGAGVAGRGHHNDPGLPQFHGRLVDRVVPVVRLGRCAEGKVQYADVVLGLMGENPVHARNHIGVAAGPVGAEGPDPYQLGPWRDALDLAAIRGVAVDDDAGDVRAVADRVVGGRGRHVCNRVVGGQHAIVVVRIFEHRQAVIAVAHAGVDDRDRHARAVDALRVQLGHAHDRHIPRVRPALRGHAGIGEHTEVGRFAQPRGLRRGKLGDDGIDDRQLARDASADLAYGLGGRDVAVCLDDEARARGRACIRCKQRRAEREQRRDREGRLIDRHDCHS